MIDASDLGGGGLEKILSAYVVPAKAWAKHRAKLTKGEGIETRNALGAALGQVVPEEISEWIDLQGKRGIPEANDAGWYIALDLAIPKKGDGLAASKHALLLLMGLVPFASDASGDQAWLSVRPHPLGVAEVFLFNHENGELEDKEGESIADFIVAKWSDEEDKDVAEARKAFAATAKKALAKRQEHLTAKALFTRAYWLLGLLGGEPAFRFAEHLAKAPTRENWKAEKASLVKEPQLAVYWMLAHLVFGDDEACKEAIALSKKSKGYAVVDVANALDRFFDGKGKSPFPKLDVVRALVAKNASVSQTGAKTAQGDNDDVAEDDAELEAIAKEDAAKRKLIERYFSERKDEAYNNWHDDEPLPDWLAHYVARAFQSGLAVDLGHPKAFAGVCRALVRSVAHPDVRAALIVALGKLEPGDERLEYVIAALRTRDEPEVVEAIRLAAWRWLTFASKIDAIMAKRQQRNTLDDMVAKDDLLQPCVHVVLARCDDEAEKLARAISEAGLGFRVLKTTVGLIFRVYGKRGMRDRIDRLERFLDLLDGIPGSDTPKGEEPGVRLDETASVAMAEASLALARLDPAKAKKRFASALAQKRMTREREAGVAACLLPGIFELDPSHREGLVWLERVLSSRGGPSWLYGALLAARAAKTSDAIEWVWPHAYIERLNTLQEEFTHLELVARETLAILGKPAPAFDEKDKFAREVPASDLGAALVKRDRYDVGAVLQRIDEGKVIEANVGAIGAWLEQMLAPSPWEPESVFVGQDIHTACALLRKGGAAGKAELARIGKLDLADWAKQLLSRK